MRLKDTGLTAQELKDMVNKYMVETFGFLLPQLLTATPP